MSAKRRGRGRPRKDEEPVVPVEEEATSEVEPAVTEEGAPVEEGLEEYAERLAPEWWRDDAGAEEAPQEAPAEDEPGVPAEPEVSSEVEAAMTEEAVLVEVEEPSAEAVVEEEAEVLAEVAAEAGPEEAAEEVAPEEPSEEKEAGEVDFKAFARYLYRMGLGLGLAADEAAVLTSETKLPKFVGDQASGEFAQGLVEAYQEMLDERLDNIKQKLGVG